MLSLRRLTPDDVPRLRRFWFEHWGGDEMIVHGARFRPDQLEGFVTEDWNGVVTYTVRGPECEIISLDSTRAGHGVGTALITAVAEAARRQGCCRIVLTTTNDNLAALSFYQKRGFLLKALRLGAVADARKLKPGIPEIGENGIPLRDEIELELNL